MEARFICYCKCRVNKGVKKGRRNSLTHSQLWPPKHAHSPTTTSNKCAVRVYEDTGAQHNNINVFIPLAAEGMMVPVGILLLQFGVYCLDYILDVWIFVNTSCIHFSVYKCYWCCFSCSYSQKLLRWIIGRFNKSAWKNRKKGGRVKCDHPLCLLKQRG